MFQCQDGLDEPGDSGGRSQMADIRFRRTDGTEALLISAGAKGLRQCRNLNGVAQRSARPMRLDVADRFRMTSATASALAIMRA